MKPVVFNEEEHSYKNKDGYRYTSATTLISKFKQPFDGPTIAAAYARKHGKTAQYWLDQWAETSRTACEKGTNFHKGKELYVQNCATYLFGQKERVVRDIEQLPGFNFDYKTLPDGIYLELLLWDHDNYLAGTSDITVLDSEFFDVDDYKTNKEIKTTSYHNWRTGHKMMLGPLSHLMDCNYVHYCLQISIYAYMIEKATGKKPRNLSFTHHGPDPQDPTKILEQGTRYDVPYMKKEVEAMLTYIKRYGAPKK